MIQKIKIKEYQYYTDKIDNIFLLKKIIICSVILSFIYFYALCDIIYVYWKWCAFSVKLSYFFIILSRYNYIYF